MGIEDDGSDHFCIGIGDALCMGIGDAGSDHFYMGIGDAGSDHFCMRIGDAGSDHFCMGIGNVGSYQKMLEERADKAAAIQECCHPSPGNKDFTAALSGSKGN